MGLRNAEKIAPRCRGRQRLPGRQRRRRSAPPRTARRLGLEGLEQRLVLASFYLGDIYPGDVMSRNIVDVGNEHIYTLTANAAQWVTVSLANTGVAGYQPQAGVYNASGTLLRSVGSGAKAVVELPAAGPYQVRIKDSNNDATGDYAWDWKA